MPLSIPPIVRLAQRENRKRMTEFPTVCYNALSVLKEGDMRVMRIGLFTDTYYPEINGVATSCLMLRRELLAMGHEVYVFAPRCRGWREHREPGVNYIASAPLLLLRDRNFALPTPELLSRMRRLRLDVVHTHSEFVLGMLGHHVAKRLSCALVHTYHTAWEDYTFYLTHGHGDAAVRNIARRYSRWWCNRFDRVVAPTGKTRDLLRTYGVIAPIDIIPSGMDIGRFSPNRHSKEERQTARKNCGVRPGERVLLYLGRMAREKNLPEVLRAFALAKPSLPDVRFVLIGEGPMREELPALAEELGVADSVSVVGPKPWEEIDRWYAVGDVFCSASHSETQGLTYVEAMAAGLTVCAEEDPCLAGVIEDGVTGILSAPGAEALSQALLRAFGEEGQKSAIRAPAAAQAFGARRFAERVEVTYRQAVIDHLARQAMGVDLE